jgi:hypothetical protein
MNMVRQVKYLLFRPPRGIYWRPDYGASWKRLVREYPGIRSAAGGGFAGGNIVIDDAAPGFTMTGDATRRLSEMQIKLYDMDTMEYAGAIVTTDGGWEYRDVTNEHMMSVTRGMPLKAVMACLASFNLVYDILED